MSAAEKFDYRGLAGANYHQRRQLPPDVEPWIANLRAEKIQPYVKPTDCVFEYGVGFGWNLMSLRCQRKVGFDIAPGLKEKVQLNGITYVDDVDLIPEGAFDVIICHHTLEHLWDPHLALVQMFTRLKTTGILLVYVPYEYGKRKWESYNPEDKAHHLTSWTAQTLGNLVTRVGFDVESAGLKRFRFDRVSAVAANRLHLGERSYRIIRAVGVALLPEYEIALVAKRRAGLDQPNRD